MRAPAEWVALAALTAIGLALGVFAHANSSRAGGSPLAQLPTGWRSSINPCHATEAEWALLPKVGPALALRLREAGQSGADLRNREHLDGVRGIGPSMLATLDPWLERVP